MANPPARSNDGRRPAAAGIRAAPRRAGVRGCVETRAFAEAPVGASPGPTPFGAELDAGGRYILSQGNIGPNRAAVPDGSTAASLTFTSAGAANVITGAAPTTETAACWVQVTPDGRHAYTTNTGSGTITGFAIGTDGMLTRLTADGRTGVTGTGTQPLDMAYADGYLYAVTAGDGGIHGFHVESDGSLTPLATGSVAGALPVSVTGLAAF
ncbi:MAG: 3-carboxymuconate cyclase [Gemmatimonadetes bacterium]|nr:3-carboxymuconate cyclase [Gemmatimonadota bacterium]